MTDRSNKAREIAERYGLVCLVPAKPEGVTSHEHTLCDCQVIAAILSAENEAYERAAFLAMACHNDPRADPYAKAQAAEIAAAIRALKDKGE